jgi:Flp pilus assembly pilin Flp
MQSAITRVSRNEHGTSITEFGLIAPVLMVMLMGTYDVGHEMYVKSVLNGALQEVGRNSALEGASNADQRGEIDKRLTDAVAKVAPNAEIKITRRYYKTFSKAAAAQAEAIILDKNGDRYCDDDESFMDANHNGFWDRDGGTNGQGGAKDIVIIKVKLSYDRLFPSASFIGYGSDVVLVSDSVIANQPYGQQIQFAPPVPAECEVEEEDDA